MKSDSIAGKPVNGREPEYDGFCARCNQVYFGDSCPNCNPKPEAKTPAAPAPSKRGDVIACGVFDGSNGQTVCWCDFVSDELLYAVSKTAKGWSTARTEPRRITDKEKQRQLRLLQNYVFSKIVCGLGLEPGGKS